MLARRHCAIEALSDLRVDVEHYVSALADVDYATNGKRDQDTALSELQKKISSDVRRRRRLCADSQQSV